MNDYNVHGKGPFNCHWNEYVHLILMPFCQCIVPRIFQSHPFAVVIRCLCDKVYQNQKVHFCFIYKVRLSHDNHNSNPFD